MIALPFSGSVENSLFADAYSTLVIVTSIPSFFTVSPILYVLLEVSLLPESESIKVAVHAEIPTIINISKTRQPPQP